MHITPLTDAKALAQLHAGAFARAWPESEFASLLGQPGVAALGRAEGFILLRAAADEAEILTLAVSPGFRRRGLARALVAAAAEWAKKAGAATLFLEVATVNEAATWLYTGCGFTRAGRRSAYYADGQDAYILRKCLIS